MFLSEPWVVLIDAGDGVWRIHMMSELWPPSKPFTKKRALQLAKYLNKNPGNRSSHLVNLWKYKAIPVSEAIALGLLE